MDNPINELTLYALLPLIIERSGNGLTDRHLFVATRKDQAILVHHFADLKDTSPSDMALKEKRLHEIGRTMDKLPELHTYNRVSLVAKVGAVQPFVPTPAQVLELQAAKAAKLASELAKAQPVTAAQVKPVTVGKPDNCQTIISDAERQRLAQVRVAVAERANVALEVISFGLGSDCKEVLLLVGGKRVPTGQTAIDAKRVMQPAALDAVVAAAKALRSEGVLVPARVEDKDHAFIPLKLTA